MNDTTDLGVMPTSCVLSEAQYAASKTWTDAQWDHYDTIVRARFAPLHAKLPEEIRQQVIDGMPKRQVFLETQSSRTIWGRGYTPSKWERFTAWLRDVVWRFAL